MTSPTLAQWAEGLASLAAPGIPDDTPGPDAPCPDRERFARDFRDERGNRPKPIGAFLAHYLDLPESDQADDRADARLWHAVRDDAPPKVTDTGPLFPEMRNEGIEIWTETELCGLHALAWHALRNPALRPRVLDAAAWHVATLQPDNATNRPWAAHVFTLLHAKTADPAAQLHAQTLAHNCRVATGVPDRASALVLDDAARCLRAIVAEDHAGW